MFIRSIQILKILREKTVPPALKIDVLSYIYQGNGVESSQEKYFHTYTRNKSKQYNALFSGNKGFRTAILGAPFMKCTLLAFYKGSVSDYSCQQITYGISLKWITISHRSICMEHVLCVPDRLKHSSKLEETVKTLKEKAKEQMVEAPPPEKQIEKIKEKKPIMQRIKAELIHYYHGFRLLFVNTKICTKFCFKILRGQKLSRREKKLMKRTLSDLFRLVPFSVFIIVPFLEFTLPVFLKVFPGMLPSTFETKSQKENKMKRKFKVQLEMASFLQETLQEMAVGGKGHESEDAAKFSSFFEKVRTAGGVVTSDEVMKFSKMFRDEVTLDNLSRAQLKALCRVLGISPIGTTKFLRFQLGLKLRSLQADDQLIQKEGVNSLSADELQTACQARGMPAWGVPEERLKQQLTQWLELSVDKKVAPSLLLLSQAFMFPSNTPTEEKLAATIQSLPKEVVTATKAEIEVREGKIDFKTQLEHVKDQIEQIDKECEENIEEERLKKEEQETKKSVVPESTLLSGEKPFVSPATTRHHPEEEVVKPHEIAALGSVLDCKLRREKEKLATIVSEMEQYERDSEELAQMLRSLKDADVQETTAAKILKNRLKKLIKKLSCSLSNLEGSEKLLKNIQSKKDKIKQPSKNELIKIDEFIEALKTLPGKASLNHERLIEIVHRLDKNKDGYVSADVLMKMIDFLGMEDVCLSKRQVNELIDLLEKEEILETDLQICKALNKDDPASELKKELEKRRAEIIEELKKEKKELDLKRKEEEIKKANEKCEESEKKS